MSELRVVDLRRFLDRRGLEKAGVKSVLTERLSKSLTEEGHDPTTYIFEDNEDAANETQMSEASHADGDVSVNADDSAVSVNADDSAVDIADDSAVDIADANTTDISDANTTDIADANSTDIADANTTEITDQVATDITEEIGEVGDKETVEVEQNAQMVELDSLAAEQTELLNDSKEELPTADSESGVIIQEEEEEDLIPAEFGYSQEQQLTEDEHDKEATDDNVGSSDNAGVESMDDDNQSTLNTEDVLTPTAIASTDNVKEVISTNSVEAAGSEHDHPTETVAKDNSNTDEEVASAAPATAVDSEVDQFVVHVDESDTNLDYDLGDKPEERDAPTPTKDESMDVDAADIVQSEDGASAAAKQTEKGVESASASQATKSLSDVRTDTPKKDSKDLAASQNLWISGLSSLTRAIDLKAVFSRHGKVIGAKVVTNANRPGAKCYGYVTMSSAEEAAKCIRNLHRTELHGRVISVEKAKSDPAAQARAASARKPVSAEDTKKEDVPSTPNTKEEGSSTTPKDDSRAKTEPHRSVTSDDKTRGNERHRPTRPASSGTTKKEGETATKDGEKKSVEKDKRTDAEKKVDEAMDREKRRLRLQERRARDDDYRRRNALLKEKRALADQQRHMRMEETRMGREREKLRIDREKGKIEEMKLDGMQQERVRLENMLMDLRQRVDREREELKRVETLRLEEIRRSTAVKRPYDGSGGRGSTGGGRYDDGWESKRPATSDRYASVSVDRRSSSAVSASDRGYSDRRPPPELERRTATVKEVVVSSRGRSDERYSSSSSTGRASGDRREYAPADGRSREPSSRSEWKQPSDPRGLSRDYHESSSRRSGGSSGGGGSWGGGSSGAPSLLTSPAGGEIFTGSAAVQAAGMMMNAAMSRGGSTNGTSGRYSGGSSSSGGYGGARRY